MEIRLNWAELFQAAVIGITRNVAALKRGLPDKHGFNGESGWSIHIEGAAGEMATAKALNLYYSSSVNVFKSIHGDVGALEVRTRSKHEYDLIVRPNDNPDSVYVLVTGISPIYRIRGWILGKDARKDEWWQTHGGRSGAWFVPVDRLNSIDLLVHR